MVDGKNRTDVLSSPVRGGLLLIVAVAVVAAGWCLRRDANAALIVAGGTIAVALALAAYATLLRSWRRRRSQPMHRAILNNSAASPNAISEPGRRAALDDLRRKFQAGLAKFTAAGKDLYSLPWYVVVGEAGGGKTEAIRHCNVGFPPGLQDYTQGAGGTLNMNWWFTNHAILLDVAGRMLFEEAPAGTTGEWDEFLQLLVRSRTNCPINGMLLVLPADSLITDSADKIERKAVVIAQQLDHIQRALRVRFPVFVVITKCDLINGFREFFDNLTDPQLQHQMLGWSNPQPLDEPFNPADVDRHLQSVRERLVRRAQSLLLDPVNSEDPTASRLEQVDALYAFPDSFLKIAPRLRRYLEMIFVVGEWSPEPLFLRGIYFTSSMREGTALDADLAEALKVPVESLKGDGRSWERERAFFLRDLFVAKVFRERGLVTRASNTKRLQRHRRALVMGTGVASILILMLLTWTGARSMEAGIGEQADYWMAVGANWHDRRAAWNIVQPLATDPTTASATGDAAGPRWRYNGSQELSFSDTTAQLAQFFSGEVQNANAAIHIPWIFRPQAIIRGDLNEERWKAYRQLFESSVVVPVLDAVRAKLMAGGASNFSPYAGGAIGELVRLEQYGAGIVPHARIDDSSAATDDSAAQQPLLHLDHLVRFLLSDEDYTRFRTQDRRGLQSALQWAYAPSNKVRNFPSPAMKARSDAAQQALQSGVATFNEAWALRLGGQDPLLADVIAVQKPLQRFHAAELDLRKSFDHFTAASTRLPADEWLAQLAELRKACGEADAAIAKMEKHTLAGWSLLALYEIQLDRDVEAALRSYEQLMAQIPKGDKTPPDLLALRESLASAVEKIPNYRSTALSSELQDQLSGFDRMYLSPAMGADGVERRRYQIHARLYAGIEQLLAHAGGGDPPSIARLQPSLQRIDADAMNVSREIAALAPDDSPANRALKELSQTSQSMTDRVARRLKLDLIGTILNQAPGNPKDFADFVRVLAANPAPAKLPVVPLTRANGGDVAPEFSPEPAKAAMALWFAIGQNLHKLGQGGEEAESTRLMEQYRVASDAPRGYVELYRQYWGERVPALLNVSIPSWDAFFREAGHPAAWKCWEVNASIKPLAEQCVAALTAMEAAAPQWSEDLNVSRSREQLAAATKQIDDPIFQRECEKLLSSWRKLAADAGFDPLAARKAMLDLTPDAWRDQFLLSDKEGLLAVKYWSDLTVELLSRLTSQTLPPLRASSAHALSVLRDLRRFPLARPRKGGKPLTESELSTARDSLAAVLAAQRVNSPNGDSDISLTIHGGAMVGIPRIDAQLNELRGVDLDPSDAAWIAQVGRLCQALPSRNAFTCTLSVAGRQQRAALPKADPLDWYSVVVGQGKSSTGSEVQLVPMPEATQKLAVCVYPGEPLQFKFFQNPSHEQETPALGPDLPGGPWQCLAMIHLAGARPLSSRKWLVPLPAPPKDQGSLPVLLEFDRDVPPVNEWPVEAGR